MTPAGRAAAEVPRDTAAAHMVSNIPRARPDTPVDTVLLSLRGSHFECADTVFITDDHERLLGIVRINDLLSGGDRVAGEIMEPEHEAVRPDDDQEQIALLAMDLGMIAVPVVDADNRLIGAVPPEALFRILRDEHMEDLQRLAGIEPHEQGPVIGLDSSLSDRFRRRLPWLVFGLLASSMITVLMAGFEDSLAANVQVAFFIPALVYISGAIGTQAVSVAVRGLASEDVSIGHLMLDELFIGFAIGSSLGLLSFGLVMMTFGSPALALAVGLAVIGGGMVSALVGFGLPWVFVRLGSDPAMGSGPICTIIQDVASLFLYFVLVTGLVL